MTYSYTWKVMYKTPNRTPATNFVQADELNILENGVAVFSRRKNEAEIYGLRDSLYIPIKVIPKNGYIQIDLIP